MSLEFGLTFKKKAVRNALNKVNKEIRRSRQILKSVGKDEVKKAQQRIRSTKVDPEGRRWRSWAPSTLKERMRRGTAGRGLLYDNGRLYRGFQVSASKTKLKVTSDVRYAKFIQDGTPRMPARKFMGWDADAIQKKFIKILKRVWR